MTLPVNYDTSIFKNNKTLKIKSIFIFLFIIITVRFLRSRIWDRWMPPIVTEPAVFLLASCYIRDNAHFIYFYLEGINIKH